MSNQSNQDTTIPLPSLVPPLFYQQQQDQHKSKRKRIQKAVQTTFATIMNAAVTIFGVGVGVGLILGDSFRGRERVGGVTSVTVTTSTSTRVVEGGPTIESVIQREGGFANGQSHSTLPPQ